ncbi:MAG: cupin domain-containing protein [Alphaproteobacteria bacterium]|nr:cupin domain-containing protein [Alphaproteobacteria bacterium]
MPKINISAIATRETTNYPAPYADIVRGRSKKAIGDAGGLTQFGVNLTRLKPGAASAHRHWHRNEDEFIFMLEGEAVLVEDSGETTLRAGDAAAFKAGAENGHHLLNRSGADAVFLEVGTRADHDVTTYTDPAIDLLAVKEGGRWSMRRRSGAPY